jgi:hypothetical protein
VATTVQVFMLVSATNGTLNYLEVLALHIFLDQAEIIKVEMAGGEV